MTPTRMHAAKVLEVVDAGLVIGLGNPKPGEACVEAAVCLALGERHSDRPSCVGAAVRAFKITLNDASWSSDKARAAGLRRLAVAQLGSDGIDQSAFASRLAERTIGRIVPIIMRIVSERIPSHAGSLEAAAKRCEDERSEAAARAAADVAGIAAIAARAVADAATWVARAAAEASRAAAEASRTAAWAADSAARAATRSTWVAVAAADSAARAADWAATRAVAGADNAAAGAATGAAWAATWAARAVGGDGLLMLSADIALEILVELESPGTAWLDLCEAA